jgi:hypothetical protein
MAMCEKKSGSKYFIQNTLTIILPVRIEFMEVGSLVRGVASPLNDCATFLVHNALPDGSGHSPKVEGERLQGLSGSLVL